MNTLTLSSCVTGKLLGISVILVISTHFFEDFYDICITEVDHDILVKYYTKMRLYMSDMLYKCNTRHYVSYNLRAPKS